MRGRGPGLPLDHRHPAGGPCDAFGFQNLFCWLAVACALGALVVEERRARLAFLCLGEGVLLAWFGWAMWVVTSPRFARLQWPFVGIDLVGPSWYIAGFAILIVAASTARSLSAHPAAMDVWLLAALPGNGLVRLDHWTRGLTWTLLSPRRSSWPASARRTCLCSSNSEATAHSRPCRSRAGPRGLSWPHRL